MGLFGNNKKSGGLFGNDQNAYNQGRDDALWGDTYRWDSGRTGRSPRERDAYERGFMDHADEHDIW